MLHIVNKSPLDRPSLDTCLATAQPGGALLLIEDGVYAATTGNSAAGKLTQAMGQLKVYALKADLKRAAWPIASWRASIWSITAVSSISSPNTAPANPGCNSFFRRHTMAIELNGKTYETDEEGYLTDISEWNEDVAKVLAEQENVNMTEQHWEVINFLREYYNEFQIAPAVRVLTKAIGKKLGPEKGNSQYLYELFPYGPAKQACKIAGLPKPTGCV